MPADSAAENLQSMPVLPESSQAQAGRQLQRAKRGAHLSLVPSAPLGLDYGGLGAGGETAEETAEEASGNGDTGGGKASENEQEQTQEALDQEPVVRGGGTSQQALRRSLDQRTKLAREGAQGAEEKSQEGKVSDATAKSVQLLTDNALTWAFRYFATFEPLGIIFLALPYINFHFWQAHLRGSQWFRKFKLWEIVVFGLLDLLVIGIIACIVLIVLVLIEEFQSTTKTLQIGARLLFGFITGGPAGLGGAAGGILGEELAQ